MTTHRFDQIKNNHRLILIDKGEIVETGLPNDLYRNKGFFYDLMMEEDGKNLFEQNFKDLK